jgi:hypothetical protein
MEASKCTFVSRATPFCTTLSLILVLLTAGALTAAAQTNIFVPEPQLVVSATTRLSGVHRSFPPSQLAGRRRLP